MFNPKRNCHERFPTVVLDLNRIDHREISRGKSEGLVGVIKFIKPIVTQLITCNFKRPPPHLKRMKFSIHNGTI